MRQQSQGNAGGGGRSNNPPVTFDTTYSYGRERIVELAQVILRDLENCLEDINTSAIFQCVSNINGDWEKKWADNPQHMDLD